MVTISDEYIKLNRELHESLRGFGGAGAKHVEKVEELAHRFQTVSLLDYGCGQGKLKEALNNSDNNYLLVTNYDPAVPDFNERPAGVFDLVVCTDVLEHVEPEFLDRVLYDLFLFTKRVAYFVIACGPANKVLSDGRNAHLIQQPPDWWLERIRQHDWKSIEAEYQWDKYKPDWVKKVKLTLTR